MKRCCASATNPKFCGKHPGYLPFLFAVAAGLRFRNFRSRPEETHLADYGAGCTKGSCLPKKLILTTAGIAAILWPLAFGAFATLKNYAQSSAETAAPRPSFEVAAIKPNRKDSPCCTYGGKEPGGYRIRNVSLKSLIAEAYGLPEIQISGGPGWIGLEHYDIEAKMSDSQYRQIEKLGKRQQEHQTNLMLQSLLAARFAATVNHQPKEFPGYALIVAKDGPKLHMSGTPVPPPSKHSDSKGGSFSGIAFQA
jgi:hypothetical protein